MARRRPAAVRAALAHRGESPTKPSPIDGLSAGAAREIRSYERSRLWPGAVACALVEWKLAVHQPVARLLQDPIHSGCPCCDPLEHRDVLAQALAALAPQARRELQAKVSALDDVFERRTHHDPLTPVEMAWWRRRT